MVGICWHNLADISQVMMSFPGLFGGGRNKVTERIFLKSLECILRFRNLDFLPPPFNSRGNQFKIFI